MHTHVYTLLYTHNRQARRPATTLVTPLQRYIQRHTPGDSGFDGWRLMTVNANSRAFPKDGQRVIDFPPRAAYAETQRMCATDIACVTRIYRYVYNIYRYAEENNNIIIYYDDVEKEGKYYISSLGGLVGSLTHTSREEGRVKWSLLGGCGGGGHLTQPEFLGRRQRYHFASLHRCINCSTIIHNIYSIFQ